MPYTLGHRQRRAYTDTVNLYKPATWTNTGASSKEVDGVSGMELAYSGVLCHIIPAAEGSAPQKHGRSDRDILDTTDRLRMHMDQECDDGWYLQLKTADHPDLDTWFVVMGGPKIHSWRAKSRTHYIKRAITPPMAESP